LRIYSENLLDRELEINPLVYAVVLNWNNAADTIECLQSLENSDYEPFVPLVIDNGSTNGSVREIRESFPKIELIELNSNSGYAAGNNVGIQHALGSGADYVMILNNDTLVEPTMLGELVKCAETDSKIGMVGPKMYCYEPDDTIFAVGSFINWSKGETTNRGLFQPASDFSHLQRPEQVDFIVGCGVLVSRKFIEQVGLLDPIYYLNFEDVDWGIRGWRKGFEVWFAPQAEMWHKVSASLGKASPANTYYMTRNALLFFWRYSPSRYRWTAILRIILRTLRSIAAWALKPQYRDESYKKLRSANIMALRDFTMGDYGQMKGDKSFSG
jgi:GT2 family glycosyltransferase